MKLAELLSNLQLYGKMLYLGADTLVAEAVSLIALKDCRDTDMKKEIIEYSIENLRQVIRKYGEILDSLEKYVKGG